MNTKGWIHLHRSIYQSHNWNISHECNTFIIYLMCRANYKDGIWINPCTRMPEKILRGSFVTSMASMAKESKLTPRQIRTCLKKLRATQFVTQEATRLFTKITVVKYNFWQGREEKATQKATQKATTIQEEKKSRKELKIFFSQKRKERESKPRLTGGGLMVLRDLMKQIVDKK